MAIVGRRRRSCAASPRPARRCARRKAIGRYDRVLTSPRQLWVAIGELEKGPALGLNCIERRPRRQRAEEAGMDEQNFVEYVVADRIATITINRPEKLNAVSDEVVVQLANALR